MSERLATKSGSATIPENVLYFLARLLYRSEVCHSSEMKEALTTLDKYEAYRLRQANYVLEAAERYGIPMQGRDILDFGSGCGALCSRILEHGARSVVGVDVDAEAIARARAKYGNGSLQFLASQPNRLPLASESIDVVVSHDVFEHVSEPMAITEELFRVLRPGGRVLIGTWGWRHPFAPHLFSVMPVPWAHLLWDERSVLRTCRRVYDSEWYQPIMHDLDGEGRKKKEKYTEDRISTEYLNKFLISDFERVFARSQFEFQTHIVSFHSWYARWTAVFLRFPQIREWLTSYVWFVLRKGAKAKPHSAYTRPLMPVLVTASAGAMAPAMAML